MTSQTESKTYWIVHKGIKYTEGSFIGYYYRTKEEAQKKLNEIREDSQFNICEIAGEYES